jgi:hypothetical protein
LSHSLSEFLGGNSLPLDVKYLPLQSYLRKTVTRKLYTV